jgi:hypothetical protein
MAEMCILACLHSSSTASQPSTPHTPGGAYRGGNSPSTMKLGWVCLTEAGAAWLHGTWVIPWSVCQPLLPGPFHGPAWHQCGSVLCAEQRARSGGSLYLVPGLPGLPGAAACRQQGPVPSITMEHCALLQQPPLCCCKGGHMHVARFFLDQGASLYNKASTPWQGETKYPSFAEVAAAGGNVDLLELLQEWSI